jgi:hypothetical protein
MKHPSAAIRVLRKESQAIHPIQEFPKIASAQRRDEMWVIESFTGWILCGDAFGRTGDDRWP